MSEYQYFEFQAVDRPLTSKQMDELRRYSSRAEITPSRFVNVYNYSDFRGDPDELIEKYFDAFLYLASWGTRRLMLRVPRMLLGPEKTMAFEAGIASPVAIEATTSSCRSAPKRKTTTNGRRARVGWRR